MIITIEKITKSVEYPYIIWFKYDNEFKRIKLTTQAYNKLVEIQKIPINLYVGLRLKVKEKVGYRQKLYKIFGYVK